MTRPFPKPGWEAMCAPYAPTIEPGLPAHPICGDDPHPPSKVALLRSADDALLRAIFGGYAGVGHMVDGNMSSKNVHRLYVAFAPGVQYAKLHATRCGSSTSGSAQSGTLVSDSATFPADMVASSPMLGTETYLETGTSLVGSAFVATGTSTAASPSTARAVSMIPGPRAKVTLHEVQNAAGFCFEPIGWIADLEDL